MSFPWGSPFSRYFEDNSIVVREIQERERNDAILWLSYDAELGLNLAVYDYKNSGYTHRFNPGTGQTVNEFLAEISDEFNVVIPDTFAPHAQEFLDKFKESLVSDINLATEDYGSCDSCGDYNENTFRGIYFPAFGNEPDAIYVHHKYGCFGGDEAYANSQSSLDEVWEIIEGAIDTSSTRSIRNEVKEFRADLKGVLGL